MKHFVGVWRRRNQLLAGYNGQEDPGYLKELFVFRNSSYSLRGKNILTLPIPRTTNYGLECVRYQAAKIWNSLPDSIRTMTSFKDFKKAIKEMNF